MKKKINKKIKKQFFEIGEKMKVRNKEQKKPMECILYDFFCKNY